MAQDDVWPVVDRYFAELLTGTDSALEAAVAASAAAGLPEIAVSSCFGKLLHLLARSVGALRILEIGTLGGYSTIWLARALPADGSGRLVTLEVDPKHAEVAKSNIARAGLASAVELRLGNALDALPQLAAEGGEPFDFAFIDADKQSNADYFAWALKLSRPGGIIVVDNVVRSGKIVDGQSTDPSVRGVRRFLEALAAEKRVTSTAIQTVGAKGYDGFAIALVMSPS